MAQIHLLSHRLAADLVVDVDVDVEVDVDCVSTPESVHFYDRITNTVSRLHLTPSLPNLKS